MKNISKIVAALVLTGTFAVSSSAQTYSGKVVGKKAAIAQQVLVGDAVAVTSSGFVGDGSLVTNLTPGNISAGSLGSSVLASSIAALSIYTDAIVDLAVTGSKIANSTIGDAKISDVTPGKISAGTLDADVVASSIAANTVYPEAAIAGTYSNISIPAANVNAGSLGASVLVSSIAAGKVYTEAIADLAVTDAKINDVAATKLTGTIANERLDDSSVTLQGNLFNGNSQLVQTTSDGKLPILDGSLLTNLNPGSVVKYATIGGFNNTLGVGTTYYSLVPGQAVTLTRLSVTVVSQAEGAGTGSVFMCGNDTGRISVTVAPTDVAGTIKSAIGTVAVADEISGWMESTDDDITPTVNAICEYK